MKAIEKTRFDTRFSKDQKEYFEYAASLGGFRTLTEFVIFSAQQEARNIIEKRDSFLESKKDQEIFFKAITNPPKPNTNLRKAVSRFNKTIAGK